MRARPSEPHLVSRDHLGPFSFVAPQGWRNRPIRVFVGKGDPVTAPTIIVAREDRRPGDSVQTHVYRRTIELSKRTPGFTLLTCNDVKIDGRAAMRAHYRWTSQDGETEQTIVWVEGAELEALTLTLTSNEAPGAAEAFERVLSTLKWGERTRESVIPPSVSPPSSHPEPVGVSVNDFPNVPMPGARSVRR